MADYLLEIGCEEIPARMVGQAVADLQAALAERLAALGLEPAGGVEGSGGPRRLAVVARGLAGRQPDRTERVVGPTLDKAFAPDGTPTRVAQGFASRLGLEVSDLERAETPKGPAVVGVRHVPGLGTGEVLARAAPEAILGLKFPKLMRWGRGELRFVRAIRWLVSLLDTEVVPFAVAGVEAGRHTRGHRFLGRPSLELRCAGEYAEVLGLEHVVVRVEERAQRIRDSLAKLAAGQGGCPDHDPELLHEVSMLVEEPHVIAGRYDPGYLELPHEVLVTSMKHHQKSFPVWNGREPRLLPSFLSVANVPDAQGHVRRGYERVLNARLADARFFWQEDRRLRLEERASRLEGVVFHEKLGSYASKARRLERLAGQVARHLGLDEERARLGSRAACLAKLDLTTGMVGEFPELQGVVGGLLLAAEGAHPDVARAVYEHYLPASLDGEPPASELGAVLAIADKLDTLVGFFGVDLIPSGTRDPFGLRRAAQGLVRTVLARKLPGHLGPLLEAAARRHQEEPGASEAPRALPRLVAYLGERVEHLLRSAGHRPDTVDAVLGVEWLDLNETWQRAQDVSQAREAAGFEEVFTVLKRVANIAGREGSSAYDAGLLQEPAERALAGCLEGVRERVLAALGRREYAAALEGLRELGPPLHRLFEKVLVMAPEPALRENRLRLLRAIGDLVAPIADFRKLQVEREGSD